MSTILMIATGYVGRDAEIRYLERGLAVASFSMAATRKWGTEDDKKEKTTWIKVTAWGKLAEIVNQFAKKGSQVYVEGDWVDVNAYTSKAGEPAASLELTARTFQILGSRGSGSANGQQQEPPSREDLAVANAGSPSIPDLSDIPF